MNFRQNEKQQIINMLSQDELPSNLLVLGPTGCGKFSTVFSAIEIVRHRNIVINCLGCYNPRSVFEGVLLNLKTSSSKTVDDVTSLANSVNCKSGAVFIRQLKDFFDQEKIFSLCIVFQNAEKLFSVLDSTTTSLFARLKELTGLNVCCIFVSSAPVEMFFARPDFCSMVITFRPYTSDQLQAICRKSLVCPEDLPRNMFDWFVEFLFRSVQSITQDLVEIQYLLASCLPRFHQMYLDLMDKNEKVGLTSPTKAKGPNQSFAFAHLHKQLSFLVELVCQHGVYGRSLFDITPSDTNECASSLLGFLPSGGKMIPGSSNLLPAEVALSHLSAQAKLLLIAAFVAAKNSPTSDRLLFESKTSKAENRFLAKQRRRNEKAKTANVNPLPQPPRMFRLRRLVSIYQYFASVASVKRNIEEEEVDCEVSDLISSDVMNAITSLVDLRLIAAAKSKDALANPAYYCNLQYEDISRVAKSVNISNLEAYLDDFGAGGGAAFDA